MPDTKNGQCQIQRMDNARYKESVTLGMFFRMINGGMTWRRYWCIVISVSRALTPFRTNYCRCKAKWAEQGNKAFPQSVGGIVLKEAFVIYVEISRLGSWHKVKSQSLWYQTKCDPTHYLSQPNCVIVCVINRLRIRISIAFNFLRLITFNLV